MTDRGGEEQAKDRDRGLSSVDLTHVTERSRRSKSAPLDFRWVNNVGLAVITVGLLIP